MLPGKFENPQYFLNRSRIFTSIYQYTTFSVYFHHELSEIIYLNELSILYYVSSLELLLAAPQFNANEHRNFSVSRLGLKAGSL